jgi:hypothetical protein
MAYLLEFELAMQRVSAVILNRATRNFITY